MYAKPGHCNLYSFLDAFHAATTVIDSPEQSWILKILEKMDPMWQTVEGFLLADKIITSTVFHSLFLRPGHHWRLATCH